MFICMCLYASCVITIIFMYHISVCMSIEHIILSVYGLLITIHVHYTVHTHHHSITRARCGTHYHINIRALHTHQSNAYALHTHHHIITRSVDTHTTTTTIQVQYTLIRVMHVHYSDECVMHVQWTLITVMHVHYSDECVMHVQCTLITVMHVHYTLITIALHVQYTLINVHVQ